MLPSYQALPLCASVRPPRKCFLARTVLLRICVRVLSCACVLIREALESSLSSCARRPREPPTAARAAGASIAREHVKLNIWSPIPPACVEAGATLPPSSGLCVRRPSLTEAEDLLRENPTEDTPRRAGRRRRWLHLHAREARLLCC